MTIWITSDTHFGHNKEFIYTSRGFTSIQEHDKTIIENWNKVVAADDTIYHLGDVMLNDNDHGLECLRQLNGNIKLVLGNHDSPARIELYKSIPNVEVIGYATIMKYKKHNFFLSHYPSITGNYDEDKPLKERVINLHGHTHQQRSLLWPEMPFIYHCGVDSNNLTPVNIEDIINNIKTQISILNSFKEL